MFAVAVFALTNVNAQTVTFQVDMSAQVSSTMGFDPAADYVDIAGTINEWDGANHHLTRDSDTAFIYSVTVADLTVGEAIAFKFRINGDWATSEFAGGGPDRKLTVRTDAVTAPYVYDNYMMGLVPVTISINMNKVIADEGFDAATEFIDVAGTMNNWGSVDELWNADADGIYVGTVLAPIGDMEWKTRINADWDNSEFAGGANRVYTVVDTAGGAENVLDILWYNDEDLTGVDAIELNNVNAYPNPFNTTLTIDNLENVNNIVVSNILGQEFASFSSFNSNSVEINTNEFESGIYIISVVGNSNNSRTMKVIKQ